MIENDGLEKDVINLLDEEGNEHEFEIVDAAEYKESEYLALVPFFKDAVESLEDSAELVILRVSKEEDENGESFLEAILDEDEYTAVANMFMDRLEDEFDFEDEDGEEIEDIDDDEVEEVD